MPEKKHRQVLDELRNMNDNELNDALLNERRKLYEMRRQNVTKQLENTSAEVPPGCEAAARRPARMVSRYSGSMLTWREGGGSIFCSTVPAPFWMLSPMWGRTTVPPLASVE